MQKRESCDEELCDKGKVGLESMEDWKVEEQRQEINESKTVGVRYSGRLKEGFLRLVMTCTSRLKDVFAASYGLRLM